MIDAASLQRLLVIAPHPDDETIGAGALIQRAVAAGGEVSALFATDGDNNPWPQRALKKKWRITADERAAWGATRRDEARAALEHLGASSASAIFLGHPDRALLRYARHGDPRIAEALRAIVADFDPTLIVSPSVLDLHADHRAIAHFVHAIAGAHPIVTYIVHGTGPTERIAARLELTDDERARKRSAIEHHTSQMLLSRERFLSYAQPVEVFYRAEHDIVRPESLLWTLRCKALHGWRVARRKGCEG